MNFQRRNVKQLLTHPPYYQKLSFTKKEYLGVLELAQEWYTKHSSDSFSAGVGLGVLGFLVGDEPSAIFGPMFTAYVIATASNDCVHAMNLKNLIKTKMVNNDYQITKHEYIAKTRAGIKKIEK